MNKLLTIVALVLLPLNVYAQGIPIKVCPNGSTVNAYQSCGGSYSSNYSNYQIKYKAWAIDSSIYPPIATSSGWRYDEKLAQNTALKNCQSKGGNQCILIHTTTRDGKNSLGIAIAANPNGGVSFYTNGKVSQLKKLALEDCTKNYGDGCKIVFSERAAPALQL